jgi:hypothetical protein
MKEPMAVMKGDELYVSCDKSVQAVHIIREDGKYTIEIPNYN